MVQVKIRWQGDTGKIIVHAYLDSVSDDSAVQEFGLTDIKPTSYLMTNFWEERSNHEIQLNMESLEVP